MLEAKHMKNTPAQARLLLNLKQGCERVSSQTCFGTTQQADEVGVGKHVQRGWAFKYAVW